MLDVLAKRRVVSLVLFPPGRTTFNVQVLPPFVETKIGAFPELSGSGVNAEAAICNGFDGLGETFGSLSRAVSPLIELGIILITAIGMALAPLIVSV
jgi:hypothetical protein